ncbi:MAG: hypothetical protein ABSD59_16490 [Terracidiphilus sp.]|jgi:hypothetical protein
MKTDTKMSMKAVFMTLSAVLLLAASPARAGEKLLPPRPVTPRETSVLLLPPLDATNDAKETLPIRATTIRHKEQYEFIARQFKMLGEAMAAKAANGAPQIKLADLSARTAGNMDLLAKRAGADWVVSIVVEESKGDSNGGRGAFTVRTRVLLQVWDARRHGWLANGLYNGEDHSSSSPIFEFKNSLDEAVKYSLGSILDAYPQVVSLIGERDMRNYLYGQKKPFVGDPKTPFSGLSGLNINP